MSEYDVDVILRLLPAGVRNALQYEYMITLVEAYKRKFTMIDPESFIQNIIRKSLLQANFDWTQKQLFQQMQYNIHNLDSNTTLPAVYPETDYSSKNAISLSEQREGVSQLSAANIRRRLRAVDRMSKPAGAITSWSPMENIPAPPSHE